MSFNAIESTTGNKENIFSIDLQEFLLRCFLPPLGGTFTTVPSNNFVKPVAAFSASLVMEGYLLRAILSISSIKTIPLSAFLCHSPHLATVSQYFLHLLLHSCLCEYRCIYNSKGTSNNLIVLAIGFPLPLPPPKSSYFFNPSSDSMIDLTFCNSCKQPPT